MEKPPHQRKEQNDSPAFPLRFPDYINPRRSELHFFFPIWDENPAGRSSGCPNVSVSVSNNFVHFTEQLCNQEQQPGAPHQPQPTPVPGLSWDRDHSEGTGECWDTSPITRCMDTLPVTFFPTVFPLRDLDFGERKEGDVGAMTESELWLSGTVFSRQISQQRRHQLDQRWFEVTLKQSCCSWEVSLSGRGDCRPPGNCNFHFSKLNTPGTPSWEGGMMFQELDVSARESPWMLDGL